MQLFSHCLETVITTYPAGSPKVDCWSSNTTPAIKQIHLTNANTLPNNSSIMQNRKLQTMAIRLHDKLKHETNSQMVSCSQTPCERNDCYNNLNPHTALHICGRSV